MISVHFYEADTFIGRLVRFFGHTTYVHCAIQIDSKHMIETDFGGKVSMTHITKVPSLVMYFDMSKLEEKYLLTKFNHIVSTKYDNSAILSFINYKLFHQSKDRFTCVELVCELLEPLGFIFINKNMTPDRLFSVLSNKDTYNRRRLKQPK